MTDSALFWGSYILLWALAVASAIMVVLLARAYSRTLDSAIEGRSEKHGPPVGGKVPERLSGAIDESKQGAIVVFFAGGCGPCKSALPTVSWVSERYCELASFIAVIRGTSEELMEFRSQLSDQMVLLHDEDGRLGRQCEVGMTPFALAVGPDGRVVAKRARVHLPDLEILMKALSKGELVSPYGRE
jgi:thiol-disulfide isomerase/thioredoxin